MTGNTCQECGRPRAAAGGTGFACTCAGAAGGGDRGADPSARPGRGRTTAEEMAAAEDFDPLRIRPYVTLEALDTSDRPPAPGPAGPPGPSRPPAGGTGAGGAPGYTGYGGTGGQAGDGHRPSPQGAPAAPGSGAPGRHGQHGPDPYAPGGEQGDHPTAVLRPVAAPLPAEMPAAAGAWRADTQELPPVTGRDAAAPAAGPARRSRRRGAAALAAVAAFAVAGTAAYASGLFDGDDGRDRVSMPDRENGPSFALGPDAPLEPPKPTGSPSASPSRTAKPSPSASASASPSASASATRSAPATSAPAAPPAPTPTAQVTGTVSEEPSDDAPGTLRLGDTGSDVRELQLRLQEIWLYSRDWQTDGVFDTNLENSVKVYQWDRGIKGDPLGVYGPQTRRALEAETREPRRR
ncbi:peptidoglycan-binding domain-containing protein [Streptomyces sp. t39]|uniref:peptidoglycan-binding domain-containing protein n=1 Tax=Streptomyces sp. t39 TaxID=1828156 RepID=UPI0011CE6F86|nr:peptidoglycan-binding domain-containing protein [Streptomyces sp. t39]TXS54956.1 peptidoglycan-binding protein [Streptomyces sp. t39]